MVCDQVVNRSLQPLQGLVADVAGGHPPGQFAGVEVVHRDQGGQLASQAQHLVDAARDCLCGCLAPGGEVVQIPAGSAQPEVSPVSFSGLIEG